MLDEFRLSARREDRQPPPEDLVEQNTEPEEVRQENRHEDRPDYQAMRDRVLRSLTTGRGSFASTSPQYRAAAKAIDRFIAQIEADAKVPKFD